jgi:glycosyltransferase involved in cell wall biosynthesis
MIIMYRYSDGGQNDQSGSIQNKARPSFFNKRELFKHFLHEFKDHQIYVVADNVSDESYQFIVSQLARHTTPVHARVFRKKYRSGAYSFLYAAKYVIEHHNDPEEIVYFLEDDYLHKNGANNILQEAFTLKGVDYVTLYDHPDKYLSPQNKGNPLVQENGEISKVFVTDSVHWKSTNSTTMTFACKLKTLLQDYQVYYAFCQTGYPYDFDMFINLCNEHKRVLISPLPSYSTHCETEHLAHLVNWETVFRGSSPDDYIM